MADHLCRRTYMEVDDDSFCSLGDYYVPSFTAILFIQSKFIGEELSDCCFLYLFEFVSVRGEFEFIIQFRIREKLFAENIFFPSRFQEDRIKYPSLTVTK